MNIDEFFDAEFEPSPPEPGVCTCMGDLLPEPLIEPYVVLRGKLPENLRGADFEALWGLHPEEFTKIRMFEREVYLPRWQQSYGKDYFFSGQVSEALPVPEQLQPFLDWAQGFDERINGLLLNWYDAEHKHYIGRHRDSTEGLIDGAPIITVSFGATRAFRMRPYGGRGKKDIEVPHGSVVVIPWETNFKFTHEVPHLAKYSGRRISITLRAFR